MKEKKDWRQLEERGFLWRLFVRYHKKFKKDMPETLTLCYFGQRVMLAAARWFVLDRLFWIFSPLFFALSVPWLIFAFVDIESLAGAVSFIVGFTFSIIFLMAEILYWSTRLEGTKLGKWLGIVCVAMLGIVFLAGVFGLVYAICTDHERIVAELPDIGIGLGITAGLLVVFIGALIGIIKLLNKFIFKSCNWRLFIEWLKTFKKEKLCPIIFYPMGFKLFKLKPAKKKSG